MRLDQQFYQLDRILTLQDAAGSFHRYSEKLSSDFIASETQRQILRQFRSGKTLYVLNWIWPAVLTLNNRPLPEGYDTYVFLFWREPLDWQWLDYFANTHPTQKIIILAEVPTATTPSPNMEIVEHYSWAPKVARSLIAYGLNYALSTEKKYRVSSLCNKPSFFKTLITAYFHKNYIDRKDLVLSWNINLRNEKCGSMNELNSTSNIPLIDELSNYYKTDLQNLTIAQEPWIDGQYTNEDFTTSRAYTDTLINFTNETFSQTQQNNRSYPTPWVSEKTRKAIIAGAAIVPVGMAGVYTQFERFGFKFDYPWDCNFDKMPGDLDRIVEICQLIDTIMSYDFDWLQNRLADSISHNYYHIRSVDFINNIDKINELAVISYLKNKKETC